MPPLTLNVCTVSKGFGDVTVKVHFDFTNNFLILKLLEQREERGCCRDGLRCASFPHSETTTPYIFHRMVSTKD